MNKYTFCGGVKRNKKKSEVDLVWHQINLYCSAAGMS